MFATQTTFVMAWDANISARTTVHVDVIVAISFMEALTALVSTLSSPQLL